MIDSNVSVFPDVAVDAVDSLLISVACAILYLLLHLSADSMHFGVLAAATHAAANRSPFTIFYNPRACPADFVVPLTKFQKSVYGTQVSIAMRFGMMFETEESSKHRLMHGSHLANQVVYEAAKDVEKFGMMETMANTVEWDESGGGGKQNIVSLREIETPESLFTFPSLIVGFKRPLHTVFAGMSLVYIVFNFFVCNISSDLSLLHFQGPSPQHWVDPSNTLDPNTKSKAPTPEKCHPQTKVEKLPVKTDAIEQCLGIAARKGSGITADDTRWSIIDQYQLAKNGKKTSVTRYDRTSSWSAEQFSTWREAEVNINTDGSARSNAGPAGVGGVRRDDTGMFIFSMAIPIFLGTNNLVKFQSLLYALRIVKELNPPKLIIEVDLSDFFRFRLEYLDLIPPIYHENYPPHLQQAIHSMASVCRGRRQRRGEDVMHPLKVSLEELYNGTSKKLSLSRNVICSKYKG
ncbi:hypothetical protein IFM89_000469 [Coptis chinensis]|uniref:Uncharacterized protein n=1 Tax=Coptis chinensis TaxID=261450 RepID=A0A835H0Q8_9MAGN|nr:hypothetical protein IFM89_000469 [Coptis chinensis]